ncbi:hypothetical protein H0H92_012453 [Tricholoma furcatifolium]|nr:hypothetical protein H0H92_012453 [Tricholoma furcatifolium]
MDSVMKKLLKHSWEKLDYIIDNPNIAVNVKTLSIVAVADSPSVFEQMTLVKALKAMPNLKVFYWFGTQPELPSEVADCLPINLESLHIQSVSSLSAASIRNFRSMRGLRQLQLDTVFHIPPRMHSNEPDISFWMDVMHVFDNTIPILESLQSPNLRCLSLLAGYMDGMSMLGFDLLTELDLCVTGSSSPEEVELRGLDLVLRHTPMLESLSIVGLVSGEVFNLLPNDPTILPRLQSFRLSTQVWSLVRISETQLFLLSQFLGHKSSMRRISLFLGGTTWNEIAPIIPTIAQLHSLEVFSLHAGALPMTFADFTALASILTPKMTSIQLVIPWDYPDTFNVDVAVLKPLYWTPTASYTRGSRYRIGPPTNTGARPFTLGRTQWRAKSMETVESSTYMMDVGGAAEYAMDTTTLN